VKVADLIANRRVEVWTTGIEMRSLPPQYVARQVVWVQGITNCIVQIADSFRAVVDTTIPGDTTAITPNGGSRRP